MSAWDFSGCITITTITRLRHNHDPSQTVCDQWSKLRLRPRLDSGRGHSTSISSKPSSKLCQIYEIVFLTFLYNFLYDMCWYERTAVGLHIINTFIFTQKLLPRLYLIVLKDFAKRLWPFVQVSRISQAWLRMIQIYQIYGLAVLVGQTDRQTERRAVPVMRPVTTTAWYRPMTGCIA